MQIRRICVIGAGISGLVTAKVFTEEGYDVTVFEKKQGLGGVWEKSRSYPELTSQNTGETYSFSDYPMPESYPDWPTAEQIRNYLESYAKHFGIIDKIRFQTEVINVDLQTDAQPTWVVTIRTETHEQPQTREENHEFDFVVVCNGTFSNPKLPLLPGKDDFIANGGQVLHSTEFNDTSMIEGKRVVVVGYGKSASDIANVAANSANECIMLFRQAMWKVPRHLLGLVNLKYILLTRFSEAWFPYRQMGRIETLLHSIGKPIVWLFWRTVETLLRLQFGLDRYGMVPEYQIDQLECSVSVAPPGFFKNIRAAKIQPIKTSIARFIPGGVELANGQQVSADVVIFGTGFTQSIPFLAEKYRRMLINEEGIFQLYRHLIHPEIPHMGFVGYNSSFYSQLTSEVGAWWLVDYVNGQLSLPAIGEMYQELAAEVDWMKTRFPTVVYGGNCLATFSLRHIEQLIKDMDENHQLKIWKGISQVMLPLDISIFHKVRQELKLLRAQK
jgi:dimethylaniline monooxygenase (N-oxide forming)